MLTSRYSLLQDALSGIKRNDSVFIDCQISLPELCEGIERASASRYQVFAHDFGRLAKSKADIQVLEAREPADQSPKLAVSHYAQLSFPDFQHKLRTGHLRLDLGIVSVSPPDQAGMCSFGLHTGLHPAVVNHAAKCVGVVNQQMPRTQGPQVHVSQFAHLLELDQLVREYRPGPSAPKWQKIAGYLACLVEDGDTLQCRDGLVERALLARLHGHKELGFHGDIVFDEVHDLVQLGSITNGVRGTMARGRQSLYQEVVRDPYQFFSVGDLARLRTLAAIPRFVAIAPATLMDLSGQASLERRSARFVWGGLGCFPEFLRGAALSPMGRSIVWLPSTHVDGSSNIRFHMPEGQAVSIPRSDIHFAVTEYGFANLMGKSLAQRAAAMVEIAHPRFRESLLREAYDHGLLGRLWTIRNPSHYPVEHVRTVQTKSGRDIHIRPAKCSDFPGLQRLFYQMSSRDIYFRFHAGVTSLSDQNAIHLCNTSYGPDYAIVATHADWTQDEVLATGCYFIEPQRKTAELALMVHPQHQNQGIGKAMFQFLVDQARQAGLDGFSAEVVDGNHASLHLLATAGMPLTRSISAGVHSVALDLRPAHEKPLVARGLAWLKKFGKAS